MQTTKDIQQQQRVALMSASGNSVNRIRTATGLHSKTIKNILQQPEIIEYKQNIQERLAQKFEMLAEQVLDSVCVEDLEKASLQNKAVSAGILLDKSRLITGQSTTNIAVLMARAVVEAQEAFDRQPNLDHLQLED